MINKILHKLFGFRFVSSQCGEDLIIESLIPYKTDGFYIDVGANHPIRFNNTFLFKNKGWKGINIEPNPSKIWLFKLLRWRDINLNVGVGTEKTEMDFYVFDESTLSTFDQKSVEEFKKIGHKVIKIIKVPIITLTEIFEKYTIGKETDLLTIDTEGYDLEVLKSNDWKKFRPRFIVVETLEYRKENEGKKLNEIYDVFMNNIGYNKIADTYINSIYERKY